MVLDTLGYVLNAECAIINDITALKNLSVQISNLRGLPTCPESLDGVEAYSKSLKKAISEATDVIVSVNVYVSEIDKKISDLRQCLTSIIEKNQEGVKKCFDALCAGDNADYVKRNLEFGVTVASKLVKLPPITNRVRQAVMKGSQYDINLEKVQLAIEIQKSVQEVMNSRLNDLMDETKRKCAVLKTGVDLTQDDINELHGFLDNWRKVKDEGHAADNRRKRNKKKPKEERQRPKGVEQERQRQEHDEKRREKKNAQERENEEEREEQERQIQKLGKQRRREKENALKNETEGRLKREKEKTKRKSDEERKAREDEAEKQMEEELRKKRGEEERLKREESERQEREKQRLEEEAERVREEKRRRLEEEEAEKERRKKEAERVREERRKRHKEEQAEREKRKREAEERAWRHDPNNWQPLVYDRPCDEVDGKRAYHGGINCIITSPQGGIERDDISCYGHDEENSIINILEMDERPVPSRIYIPHSSDMREGEESVVKLSINGYDWVTVLPVTTTQNIREHEEAVEKMTGVEVNNFTNVKAVVVNRPSYQTIIVDKPGVSVHSSMDRNVKLFVPREAFLSRTQLLYAVHGVSQEAQHVGVEEEADLENVSVRSLITLIAPKPSGKNIEIDIFKPMKKQGNTVHLIRTTKDNSWRFAEVEYKGHHEELTVLLPPGKGKYTIMELETPWALPHEKCLRLAKILYKCINKTVVRMIVKQHQENPELCTVRIVRKEHCKEVLNFLTESGYTEGPDMSAAFSVSEGQHLQLRCNGNIQNANESNPKQDLTYLSYMGGAGIKIKLCVKDTWKQKDLPAFVGAIKCFIQHSENSASTVELIVRLPKPEKTRTVIAFAKVRFPYYLTSLANFLSQRLCQDEFGSWEIVLRNLLGESGFNAGCRKAKRKVADSNVAICKAMLLDWMKAQAVNEDKLRRIAEALQHSGHRDIAESCIEHVRFHKEYLSDAALTDLASRCSMDVQELGQALGMSELVIANCITANCIDIKQQYKAILMEWRESEDIIMYGDKALDHLRQICV